MIITGDEYSLDYRYPYKKLQDKLNMMITKLLANGWLWDDIMRELTEFDNHACWALLYEAELIIYLDEDSKRITDAYIGVENDYLYMFDIYKQYADDDLWESQFDFYFQHGREQIYNIAFK